METIESSRDEYRGAFDSLLCKYRSLNLTNDDLKKEKSIINAEIENIRNNKPKYKRKANFGESMTGIAIVTSFYSLAISNIFNEDKALNIGIIIILGIFILAVIYRLLRLSKKDQFEENNINIEINKLDKILVKLNIEIQVIEYLIDLNYSNIKNNLLIKEITKEVSVYQINK